MQVISLQNLVVCNPVAPVSGGVPQRNSKGCITGYTLSNGPSATSTAMSSSSSQSSSITSGNWSTDSSSSMTIKSNWDSSRQEFVTNSGAQYTDSTGNDHDIILDREARGFWKDQFGNSHKLAMEQNSRSVFFKMTSGHFHTLNVDTYGRLSVTNEMTGSLEDVKLDKHGRAFYMNEQGDKVFLVTKMNSSQSSQSSQNNQGMNNFSDNVPQSQGQQSSQKQNWGTQTTQQTSSSSIKAEDFEGHMFFMDSHGLTHKLFIDTKGGYWMNKDLDVEAVSQKGTAYYLNSNNKAQKLLISNMGEVGIRKNGTVEVVHENREELGYFTNEQGQSVYLVKQAQAAAQNDFSSMQDRSQFQQSQKSSSQQSTDQMVDTSKMFYMTSTGLIFDMKMDSENRAMYMNHNGQLERCTNEGKAYYLDYKHEKQLLTIMSNGTVFVSRNGNQFPVHEDTEGLGFTLVDEESMYLGSSKMIAHFSSMTSGSSGFGSFKPMSKQMPSSSQPASCTSSVSPVVGGTPVRNSHGCITSYTVGLQLLMI